MTTPNEGVGGFGDNAASDPLPEATSLVRGAADAGYQLKILGGLGVRVLCPDFPPRLRAGQDIDLACLGKTRRQVADHLERAGCGADRRFNNLNGDRQMYFTAPSGRPVDVMVDRLTMCHTLDLRPAFGRLPLTIDAVDVLLSKLQILELNEKDARDLLRLLSADPVSGGGGSLVGAAGGSRSLNGPGGTTPQDPPRAPTHLPIPLHWPTSGRPSRLARLRRNSFPRAIRSGRPLAGRRGWPGFPG